MFNLTDYLENKRRIIDNALEMHIPTEDVRPSLLHKAMRYSVFSGGKRIRPILCMAAAEAVGGNGEDVILPAIAIEAIHTYTLIHDDLPAMDDDNLRRGRPTSHTVFGEAAAILAGDALLTLAFEWLAESSAPTPFLSYQYSLEIAEAAGSRGVIAGQIEDLSAEGAEPDEELLEYIHLHKTASLIRAAVRVGGIAGSANTGQFDALTLYGCNVGLAFQIADDILNETSSHEILGKPSGTDRKKKKMTYVSLFGTNASRKKAQLLVDQALDALKDAKALTPPLEHIARFVLERPR